MTARRSTRAGTSSSPCRISKTGPALLKILEKAILTHTKIKSRYVKYEKLKNLTISKSALAKKEKFQLPQGPGRSRSNAFSSM